MRLGVCGGACACAIVRCVRVSADANNKDVNPAKEPEEEAEEREAPRMVILGQANEDGLGMVNWWLAPQEEEQQEEP